MKRSLDSSEHIRALGIIAYIESFQRIAKALPCDKLPEFFADTARASIEASQRHVELELARKSQSLDSARNYAFWFTGISLTVLGLVIGFAQDDVPADEFVVGIANWIKRNLWVSLVPITVSLLAVYGSSLPLRARGTWLNFRRDLIRLMMTSKTVSSFILLAVGFGVGWQFVEYLVGILQKISD